MTKHLSDPLARMKLQLIRPFYANWRVLAVALFLIADAVLLHAQTGPVSLEQSPSSAELSLSAPASSFLNASAQASVSKLPDTPSAVKASTPSIEPQSYYARAGFMCGSGSTTSSAGTKPIFDCGVGFTFVPLPIFVELGAMGPQENRRGFSGYVSIDGNIPLRTIAKRYQSMALIGYSRLFETGTAFDYGIAIALPRPGVHKDDDRSIRIELRDYWTFANPSQHNVMLRIGWMLPEYD